MKYKMYSILLVTLVLSGYQSNAWSQANSRLVINSYSFDTCLSCETKLAVDLSQSPVPIMAEALSLYGMGIYLRWDNRPLMGNCPPAGTSLEDGSMMLDLKDGNSHSLRRYSTRRIPWHLDDPAFAVLGSYYFQACTVDHVSQQFTGHGSNQVEAEVVDKLPDLVVAYSMLYRGGPKGGGGVFWVTEKEFRSDLGGDPFKFKVYVRPGHDQVNTRPPAEIVFDGEAMLVPGVGTVIEIPAGRIPQNGRRYTVMIGINGDRYISESTHSNNFKAENWQVNKPAIFSLDKLRVHGNCDDGSTGEWEMLLRLTSRGFEEEDWKMTVAGFDVKDNTDYPLDPNRKGLFNVEFYNIPLDNSLEALIAFENCDGRSCDRNRITFTGWKRVELTPSDRTSGNSVIARKDDIDYCGFTAELKLMDLFNAQREGYEPTVRCRPNPKFRERPICTVL